METTLYSFPIIRDILSRTNHRAEKLGIVAFMKSLIRIGRNNLEVTIPKETWKTLAQEPVLIISNHPAESDVPLLLSILQEREDTYLIASHHFLKILPDVDKNIIPVYISHHHWETNDVRLKIFNKVHHSEIYNQEEAHAKNRESIALAGEKINAGGVVVIYPAAQEMNHHFRNGVGFLMEQIQNPKKAKIVMTYIKGTSPWDYLRLVPFLGKIMPKIKIVLSKPFPVNEVITSDGKATTKKLETKYNSWTKKLGKLID